MPREVTVTFDDDSKHVYQNVPDAATPEEVTARASQEAGGKRVKALDGGVAPKPPTALDTALSVGKDVARGTGKTLATAAEFAGKMFGMGWPDGDPSSPTAMVERFLPTPKGDGTGRSFVRAAAEGAGGALVAPGNAAKNMLTGGLAGVGGETGERVSDGNPAGRILGTLAGGLGGGAVVSRVSSAAPTRTATAAQVLEGLPPGALEKAKAFQSQAATQGVTVDLAQALEGVGVPAQNLTTLRNLLANTTHGKEVQALLRNQPGELELTANTAVGGMKGNVREPGVAANNLAEAATKSVNNAKLQRSNDVRGLYDQAGELTAKTRSDFVNILSEARGKPGTTEATVAAIDKTIAKLKESPTTGAPMTHALDFDTLIGDFSGPFKGTPLSPVDPKTAGQIKNIAGQLNGNLQGSSKALKDAEARYGQISRDIVDPLKQGPVGTLATPRGYRPDTQASVAKLKSIFNEGVDPQASTSSIRTLGKEINKVDPEVFADAAKTHYSGKVAQAFEPTLGPNQTAATNATAASKLWDSLFGDKKQWQALKDTATIVAEGHGQNPTEVVRGLEAFGQLVRAARNRPDTVGGLSREEAIRIGGRSNVASGMRAFGFLPFERGARALEDRVLGKTMREFDQILTSPEGAKMLAALGKKPVISESARNILATWGAAEATAPDNGR